MKSSLTLFLFCFCLYPINILAQIGEKLGNANPKPNLYIISIGVSKDGREKDLVFPKKDAEDVLNTFLSQDKHLFGKVDYTILTCKQKTGRSQIGDTIAQYKDKGIQKKDVLIVFLSGHGQVSDALDSLDFGFRSSDGLQTKEYTLIFYRRDILKHLNEIDCKKLIFIDACQSGAANAGQKGSDFAEIQKRISKTPSSTITISSSSESQSSYEHNFWNNGAFTKVLVEGLNGNADNDNNGNISVQEISNYLIVSVPPLVQRQYQKFQTPRIANFQSNIIPSDFNYVIFDYKNKQDLIDRKVDICDDTLPPQINNIAIIGLKPNSTNEYDNLSSTIIKKYLEEGAKGNTKFAPTNQAMNLAKSGIVNKLCNGDKVFIPAEYNPIKYILVLKRSPTEFRLNPDQIWTATINFSYFYINTLTKEVEESKEETMNGADSSKTEAEKRAIERVLEVINPKR